MFVIAEMLAVCFSFGGHTTAAFVLSREDDNYRRWLWFV